MICQRNRRGSKVWPVRRCPKRFNNHDRISESAPLIDQSVESDIVAEEGHYATLRCIAYGYPKPVINWQKGATIVSLASESWCCIRLGSGNTCFDVFQIDRSGGRYKLVDGVLQVIGLHKSDSGSYICTADNGIPNAAIKEFKLTVKGTATDFLYLLMHNEI